MYKENHSPRIAASQETRRLARRRFLRGLGWGVGGLVGYGALIEPNLPFVSTVTVPIAGLPPAFEGFRIAAISDLHLQPLFPDWRLRPVLDVVQREKPDMITILGDYVNSLWPKERNKYLEECAGACSALKAPQGAFAIFGNHDYEENGDPPLSPWRSANIRTLSDEVTEVWRGSDRIFLVGLRSALMRPTSPWSLLAQPPRDTVKIVLWHEPDRADETAAAGGSLQLSGHTHGGTGAPTACRAQSCSPLSVASTRRACIPFGPCRSMSRAASASSRPSSASAVPRK